MSTPGSSDRSRTGRTIGGQANGTERSGAPLRTRPTPAMTRAAFSAVILMLAALLASRVELLLIALPLMAWTVVALVRRLLHGQTDDAKIPGPRTAASDRQIAEGSRAVFEVRGEPGMLVAATWPRLPHTTMVPRDGGSVGAGRARLVARPRRWGRYQVGPAHVLVADAMGAYREQRTLPAVPLEVTPDAPVLDAPLDLPNPLGMSGPHLSRRRGDGTALADVREFRPGDRLTRINWRVTSRTGTMHTNATFTEQDTDVLIVTDSLFDVEPPPHAPVDSPTSLDVTIRAATAIARHYLGIGDRVGIHDLGPMIQPLRAGAGPRQLRMVSMTMARAERGSVGGSRPVRRLRSVRAGTLVVMCTPLLSPHALEQIGDLLASGAELIVVDTLPGTVGRVEDLHGRPTRARGTSSAVDRCWDEAWTLRRLQRRETVDELRRRGVPVTTWEGPASLTPVLMSLAVLSRAPKMRRS
ncbi:MAG: DUF58 domain-containing protein [Brachybacterium sp.]|nr:DUF58 domain-containing protein [Brachybacterium sp.]